ncbi:hypothetical protein [Microbacterium sp. NIBRBAC000506063]|uniref:hypothetical protein n=1 Tax=Microbacterium sp. NIBRBAC000506063 TaxID=2734618 RepID=UPI001BB5C400|nr:hypothetical protein [Microbacterium sp. NIBRBAC000506063]QTV80565.1 hypothetical protein KAE78_06840 [Microbacterium sp. NIBRBAC000506063]
MHPLIRRAVKKAKLAYLWVTRILLSPNRFKVGFFTRIRFAVFGGFMADQVALYDLKKNPATPRSTCRSSTGTAPGGSTSPSTRC